MDGVPYLLVKADDAPVQMIGAVVCGVLISLAFDIENAVFDASRITSHKTAEVA